MDHRRIVFGGLAAGLVVAAGEALMNLLLIVPGVPGSAARGHIAGMPIAVFILRCLALGVCMVLLYALARPRLGGGPRTAVTIALVLFVCAVAFPPFGLALMGGFPARLILRDIIWAAVELPLALLMGAWIYQEGEAAQPETANA